MKVLLVHNYYKTSAPSGEDVVFENERALLEDNGVHVVVFKKSNDEIKTYKNKLVIVLRLIWDYGCYREMKQLLQREKPDLVHIHNIWYLISPAIYYACASEKVPIVQTIHNFRLVCANGLLLRNGGLCELCIGRKPWRGIIYKCYRNSFLYSFSVVMSEWFHGIIKTWDKKVSAFIVPSCFVKSKLERCGIGDKNVFVKPHFTSKKVSLSVKSENYGVFIGRVSEEKGVRLLIEAVNEIRNAGICDFLMKVIGDGPDRFSLMEQVACKKENSIQFLGKLSNYECMDILKKSRFLVIPSICYETFSMAAIEAFSCGKPVIASRLGALQEIVTDNKTGLLFDPFNKIDLAKKMIDLINNAALCSEMGMSALLEFNEKYNASTNYQMLQSVYLKVLRCAKFSYDRDGYK